jgi:hypothetical protein
MLRSTSYAIAIAALVATMTATAAEREQPRDPGFVRRTIRIIKLVIGPLGDYVSPPHP